MSRTLVRNSALVALAVAMTGTVVAYAAYRSRSALLAETIQTGTAERSELRTQLATENIEYRGFKESLQTMPSDEKKKYMSLIQKRLREYGKSIGKLERREERLSDAIRSSQASHATSRAEFHRRLIACGAVALISLAGLAAARRGA